MTRHAWVAVTLGAFAAGCISRDAGAQSLAQRVDRAPDGRVRFSFKAKPGVCGFGENIHVSDRDDDEDVDFTQPPCLTGPVRVVLKISDRQITGIRTRVGGEWRPSTPEVTDLGMVAAPEAAKYLLSLAGRLEGGGEKAIFPATIADSAVVWPTLLSLARSSSVSRKTRHQAIFWLGQAAERAATRGLEDLAVSNSERGVQEQAVFALSQRPKDEGIPVLINIARTHHDPAIRKKALFWLGQSEDPRALALFEELLSRR